MNVEMDLLEIREKLEAERQEILESLEEESNNGSSSLPTNPDHGDLARIYDNRQRNLYLRGIAEEKLEHIEAALQRIDAGTYGLCKRCGDQIHPERLKALPYADLCVPCQSRAES
jgi:RNA polymerase-binding protein DksA